MKFLDQVKQAGRRLNVPLIGFPGMLLNGTTINDNLHDSTLQAETLIALHRRFPLDIVFPMMDLTVEAESLGCEVDWDTDEMPTIKAPIVRTMADAEALTVPEVGVNNRLNTYVETCSLLRKAFPEKLVWGYVLGPFSIAGRLMGMTEISIATKLEPEIVHTVVKASSDLLSKYITAILQTGVDGVMILEPASSLLRADDSDEFSNSYITPLVQLIKLHGKTPSLHNCGSIDHMIENLCATGIEALHINYVCDARSAYERIPEDVVLMGSLDPSSVLLQSTPDQIESATHSLLTKMADCERFIISSGCDVAPGTPLANIEAYVTAVESFDYQMDNKTSVY